MWWDGFISFPLSFLSFLGSLTARSFPLSRSVTCWPQNQLTKLPCRIVVERDLIFLRIHFFSFFFYRRLSSRIHHQIRGSRRNEKFCKDVFLKTTFFLSSKFSVKNHLILLPFPISKSINLCTSCCSFDIAHLVWSSMYVHVDSLRVHPLIRAILRVSGFRRFFSKRSNGTRIHERLPSRCCMQISLPPSRHTVRRREYESCCDERPLPHNRKSVPVRDRADSNKARCLYPALQLFFHRSAASHAREESLQACETWELVSALPGNFN